MDSLRVGSQGLLVGAEFAELGGGNAREAVGGGAEQIVEPVAVEDWNAPPPFFECFAHVL